MRGSSELALDGLAAWRLARLVTEDEITRKARTAAIDWTLKNQHPQLRYLVTCPHCVGVYAAAVVLALGRIPVGRRVRDLLAVAGVVSAAATLLADLAD